MIRMIGALLLLLFVFVSPTYAYDCHYLGTALQSDGTYRHPNDLTPSNRSSSNVRVGPGIGRSGWSRGSIRSNRLSVNFERPKWNLPRGRSVAEVCRSLGVPEQTYYRWRKEYGGLKMDQAKRLKVLEQENTRLRRAVAALTLDKQILQEVTRGNG